MAFLRDIKRNPAYKKQLNGLLPDQAAADMDVVDFEIEPEEEELDQETEPSLPAEEDMVGGDGQETRPSDKALKKRKAIRDVLASLKASE
jgi:hypothetical protein